MAYIIYNNDNTVLLTLADGEIDTDTTALTLVGKNVNNYGQYVNNNFTKLLTNFASANVPTARVGQLWYDTGKDSEDSPPRNKLMVYNGTEFDTVYGATISGTQPTTTSTGDIWYNSIDSSLNIWSGMQWYKADPRVYNGSKYGIFNPEVPFVDDDFSQVQDVSVIYSKGVPVGLITTSSYAMPVSDAIVYFGTATTSTVIAGVTLLDNLEVRGNISVRGSTTYDKNLVTYYDISGFGNPVSLVNINAGNIAIRNDLAKLFPVTTISTLSQVAYSIGSEARVLCFFNGVTSVRRFVLDDLTPGVPRWEPLNLYYDSVLLTDTNIVP
jgi:hypothetical protein